tara:strand:- start:8250 stop:10295 length:2046 start_codon:yes stop_codon:yes gene_type:complete
MSRDHNSGTGGDADFFSTGGALPSASSAVSHGTFPAHTRLAGRYILQSVLGAGGMGEVYKAEDTLREEIVALKILHPQHGNQPELRRKFLRELKVTEQLNHPGIIRVLGIDQDTEHDVLCIVMELLEGQSLEDILNATSTGLPLEQAMNYIKSLCEILDYAHGQGVIHRDLKPSNVMVLQDDSLKLLDFGIARAMQSQEHTQNTSMGWGTAYYMAPEQLESDTISPRADIFSLGVMSYKILMGSLPVGIPKKPSQYIDAVTPAFDQALFRAIAHEPEERYASAGELYRALQNSMGANTHRHRSIPSPPPPRTPIPPTMSPSRPIPSPPPPSKLPSALHSYVEVEGPPPRIPSYGNQHTKQPPSSASPSSSKTSKIVVVLSLMAFLFIAGVGSVLFMTGQSVAPNNPYSMSKNAFLNPKKFQNDLQKRIQKRVQDAQRRHQQALGNFRKRFFKKDISTSWTDTTQKSLQIIVQRAIFQKLGTSSYIKITLLLKNKGTQLVRRAKGELLLYDNNNILVQRINLDLLRRFDTPLRPGDSKSVYKFKRAPRHIHRAVIKITRARTSAIRGKFSPSKSIPLYWDTEQPRNIQIQVRERKYKRTYNRFLKWRYVKTVWEIENKSVTSLSKLKLTVRYYDRNDAIIKTDDFYALSSEELPAGEVKLYQRSVRVPNNYHHYKLFVTEVD